MQISNYRHGDYGTLKVVKGKVHPITCHEGSEGEYKYSPTPSLT